MLITLAGCVVSPAAVESSAARSIGEPPVAHPDRFVIAQVAPNVTSPVSSGTRIDIVVSVVREGAPRGRLSLIVAVDDEIVGSLVASASATRNRTFSFPWVANGEGHRVVEALIVGGTDVGSEREASVDVLAPARLVNEGVRVDPHEPSEPGDLVRFFVNLTNHGDSSTGGELEIFVDGVLNETRPLPLPAHSHVNATLRLVASKVGLTQVRIVFANGSGSTVLFDDPIQVVAPRLEEPRIAASRIDCANATASYDLRFVNGGDGDARDFHLTVRVVNATGSVLADSNLTLATLRAFSTFEKTIALDLARSCVVLTDLRADFVATAFEATPLRFSYRVPECAAGATSDSAAQLKVAPFRTVGSRLVAPLQWSSGLQPGGPAIIVGGEPLPECHASS